MTVIPHFIHDCPSCIFVMQGKAIRRRGIFPAGWYDVYVCPIEPAVVIRTGDEGWEYSSRSDHGKDSYFADLWQAIREDFGQDEMRIYKSQLRHAIKARKRTDRAIERSLRRTRNREFRQATARIFRDMFPPDPTASEIF